VMGYREVGVRATIRVTAGGDPARAGSGSS
jgi:hypothetical protein